MVQIPSKSPSVRDLNDAHNNCTSESSFEHCTFRNNLSINLMIQKEHPQYKELLTMFNNKIVCSKECKQNHRFVQESVLPNC